MKRSSHAVHQRPGPATPAGDLAQPDERDETTESGEPVDLKALGPRGVIEQAARDIGHGLQDTDLHGTPSNVPGPHPGETEGAAVPAEGGNRRSYADDQLGHAAGKNPRKPGSAGRNTGRNR